MTKFKKFTAGSRQNRTCNSLYPLPSNPGITHPSSSFPILSLLSSMDAGNELQQPPPSPEEEEEEEDAGERMERALQQFIPKLRLEMEGFLVRLINLSVGISCFTSILQAQQLAVSFTDIFQAQEKSGLCAFPFQFPASSAATVPPMVIAAITKLYPLLHDSVLPQLYNLITHYLHLPHLPPSMAEESKKQRMERGIVKFINLTNNYTQNSLNILVFLSGFTLFHSAFSHLLFLFGIFRSRQNQSTEFPSFFLNCHCGNWHHPFMANLVFHLAAFFVILVVVLHHLKLRHSLLKLRAHLPLNPSPPLRCIPFPQLRRRIVSFGVSFAIVSLASAVILAFLCDI